MLHHLRLLNPFVRISGEAESRTAARAGAIGAFLSAGQLAGGLVTFFLFGDAVVGTAGDPQAQRMVEAMAPDLLNGLMTMMTWFALVFVALGVIQWWRPNRIIPLFLILIAVLGLFATLRGQLTVPPELKAAHAMPLWHGVLNRAASTAELLLFIVGLRGAILLRGFQKSTSAPATE